ncbi:YdcH family protein [Ponticaulis profundi]|uniref:YdcH family protein n=1 Tax=Ponticaulis profundi TaxID=2665222 RepID=A0ABW1S9J2_9PROT
MDDMHFSFDENERVLESRLSELENRHRELDSLVAQLHEEGADMLRLQRLKRDKLRLRDEISRIRNALYPNIIA